jgi:predicted RNA polymerase sigma factor
MRKRKSSISDLHAQVSDALRLGRVTEALELYEVIEKRKPKEPRWSHRKGDLLHRMGRDIDAVTAYQRAVDLYAAKGFDALASATAKLMRDIETHQLTGGNPVDVGSPRAATEKHVVAD